MRQKQASPVTGGFDTLKWRAFWRERGQVCGDGLAIVFSIRFRALEEDRSLREGRFLPTGLCRTVEPTAPVGSCTCSLDAGSTSSAESFCQYSQCWFIKSWEIVGPKYLKISTTIISPYYKVILQYCCKEDPSICQLFLFTLNQAKPA